MQFQAIILALVILVSLFITRERNEELNPEGARETRVTKIERENSFLSEFSQSISRKAGILSKEATNNAVYVGQSLALNTSEEESILKQFWGQLSRLIPEAKLTFNTANPGPSKTEAQDFPPAITANDDTLSSVSRVPDYCSIDAPGLTGRSILVKYLNYNLTIFDKNPHQRWPIASITKLMTSIIALEELGAEGEVLISDNASQAPGNLVKFEEGERFRVIDLVKAMMISSSNQAAEALAEALGRKEFALAMQRKAADLKMFDTTYIEPTGLSFINQSTVADLNKLVIYIYDNYPEIFLISRQREAEILELNSKKAKKLPNIDVFAGEPDFLGGKTGYIDEAGRNLVAVFNIRDKIILSIIFGAEDAFQDTKIIKDLIQACERF